MITAYTENAARRNVRLKAERSVRRAEQLQKHLAKRDLCKVEASLAELEQDLPRRTELVDGAGI